MTRHAVGVMNGNFRGGDYYHYAIGVKNSGKTGTCARHKLPIGKCFHCWSEEKKEQERIMANITLEAHEAYIHADEDLRSELEIGRDLDWLDEQATRESVRPL